MKKIKAAVTREFGAPMAVEEVHLRAPLPSELEVKLSACAICHSDIAYAEGYWGGTLPAVFGHEAAGHITAIGDGVTGYTIGDPVIVTLMRHCGMCATCGAGSGHHCESQSERPAPLTDLAGNPVFQAMHCGAFAEHVIVDASQIARIPETMPLDAASLLSCGVITGVGAAVNTAGIRAGQTALIIGAGGVGLNAIQGARIAGAARIIAVDLLPEKLEVAREFGATDCILATDEEPWRDVADITSGAMADAVLVSVGAIAAFNSAPSYLARGGSVVMVGMPHSGAMAQYEPVNFASLGQKMLGSKMGDVVLRRDIPWMIDLYTQGRLKIDELISRRWSLHAINDAIADTKSGTARRNVVIFDETD